MVGALIATIGLSFFASRVGFESDMNKMSFMDEETRLAEKHLDEVNNFAARSVYIFATGKTTEEAMQLNEFVYQKLDSLKQAEQLKKVSSISVILPSKKRQIEKLEKWNSFFSKVTKDSIQSNIIKYGADLKFKPEAFASFYELLNKDYSGIDKSDRDTLNKLLLHA